MIEIESDTLEIERALESLNQAALENGAQLDKGLVICCRGGELTLEAPRPLPPGLPLITLPESAVLALDRFSLAVQGNDICIVSKSKDMSAGQDALLEAMITIYNLTGKIASHRACATDMLYFNDSDLLCRLGDDAFVEMCAARKAEDFVLKSFLVSREFDFRAVEKSQAPGQGRNLVINPIVDFFNHHPRASGYANLQGRVAVKNFSTPETGAECFVRYGAHDDHLMLLGYGYAETKTPFVISQAMEIEVPGIGVIHIHRRPGAPHNYSRIPPQLEGLERFLPQIKYSDEDRSLDLSCLHIPPAHMPRALRRILRFHIGRMNGHPKGKTLSQAVRHVERELVERNRGYYLDLLKEVSAHACPPETAQIIKNIEIMANSQLGKIDAHALS